MIYIRMIAYNAAKTLARAVNSVLQQTRRDFRLYLCDNGSTDNGKTRRLVDKYARLDERINPFYNEKNFIWNDATLAVRDLAHQVGTDDYFCVLDADDEYTPTFLEESLTAMQEHDCDIVACGSDFYRSISFGPFSFDRFERNRLLPKTMVLEGQRFADCYPVYSSFTKTMWGKMYRGSTLRNTITYSSDLEKYPLGYGGDTFFALQAFRDARRVVVLPRSLHKYYQSRGSSSFRFAANRVKCDQLLLGNAIDYLRGFGEISPRNWDFLFVDYLRAIRTTATRLMCAQNSLEQKLIGLHEMFSCHYTRELAARNDLGSCFGQDVQLRHKLFVEVADWLLGIKDIPTEYLDQVCDIGEFICASEDIGKGHIFRELRGGRGR